jgi:hypothetical protein
VHAAEPPQPPYSPQGAGLLVWKLLRDVDWKMAAAETWKMREEENLADEAA